MAFQKMFRESFFRYLFTYMTYTLLLLAIVVVYSWQNMKFWQESECNLYESILTNRVTEFQDQLSNLSALGKRIEMDNRYQSLSRQKYDFQNADYVITSTIQKDFFYTIMPYSLVGDCGIYYQDDLIITRNRSFIGEQVSGEYYKSYFQVEGYSKEEWFELLSPGNPTSLHVGLKISSHGYGEQEVLVWTVPLGHSTLYTVINAEKLANFFLPEEVADQGYFYVTDTQGERKLDGSYQERRESGSFYEIEKYNSFTGLNYVIGIPAEYLNAVMKPVFSALSIYAMFLLLGAAVLGVFFAWRNQRPMRRLVLSVKSYDQSGLHKEIARNEQDYVEGVMKQLHTTMEHMSEQLELHRGEEKRHFLDKVIQGGGITTKDMLEQFRHLFPELSEGCCVVILIFTEEILETEDMQLSRRILVEHALKKFYGREMTVTFPYLDTLTFLLAQQEEQELKRAGKCTARELQDFLKRDYGQQTQVVVSDPIKDVLEISSAYVATLYQYRAVMETDGQAQQKPSVNGFVSFDFMYHQQFFEALSNGEETIVLSLLKKIQGGIVSNTSAFDDKHMGEVAYRTVYMGNLSGLCNILLQVKLNYFDVLNHIRIPTVRTFRSVESFFEELCDCCSLICEKLKENRKQIQKRQLQQRVMNFLGSHMTDSTLSTQRAADYFRISDTTLQKIIRNGTGKTFAEYVEDCRVEMALQLLRTSEDSAESIAIQCGFSSYNSMYKVFKRRFDQSPKAMAQTGE